MNKTLTQNNRLEKTAMIISVIGLMIISLIQYNDIQTLNSKLDEQNTNMYQLERIIDKKDLEIRQLQEQIELTGINS